MSQQIISDKLLSAQKSVLSSEEMIRNRIVQLTRIMHYMLPFSAAYLGQVSVHLTDGAIGQCCEYVTI